MIIKHILNFLCNELLTQNINILNESEEWLFCCHDAEVFWVFV